MRALNWLIWVCAGLLIAVALIPTLTYQAFWLLFTGKDAAAWVQAFGSIAAILGTGLLGVFQIRENRKAANRIRAHALEDQHKALAGIWSSAIGLIVRAEGSLTPLIEHARNTEERKRWAHDIEPIVATLVDVQALLRGFPSYLFANARATLELTAVVTNLHTAEMATRRVGKTVTHEADEDGKALEAILTQARSHITKAIANLYEEWAAVEESHRISVEQSRQYLNMR